MRKRFVIFSALAIALSMLATVARAQDADTDTSSPDAFNGRAVRLVGNLIGKVSLAAGTCTQGFSNQCAVGHSCGCYSATGARFHSSRFGKGSAAIFVTVDNSASYGALGDNCQPAYGELDINAKNDLAIFDMLGGLCTDPNGNLIFNGTMGLESSTKLFNSNGYAGFTSTINGNSGRIVLKFKGAAQ